MKKWFILIGVVVLISVVAGLVIYGNSIDKKEAQENKKEATEITPEVNKAKEISNEAERQCKEYIASLGRPMSPADRYYNDCKQYQ